MMPDSVAQLAPGSARYCFGIAQVSFEASFSSQYNSAHMKYTLTLTAQLKHRSF